jgi:hypothetical protein
MKRLQYLTEEQNKEFDAQHGDEWFELPTPAGALAFRKPSQADFERFTEKVGGASMRGNMVACREICLCSLLHPDMPGAEAIFRAYPHAPQKAAAGLQQLAGAELEIVTKGR